MAIGETFLSAFLQVLFEQMLSTGGKKFLKLIGGVDLPKTINKWKKDLTWLGAHLEDAELQQFHSEPVKLWLNDLQDLAYDIEDLLDHFAIEEQRYQLKQAEEDQHHGILDNMVQTIYASGSRAAGSLSTLFNPVDQDIREKIDDISERLQDIKDQTQSLSLTVAHMLQQQTLQTETLRSDRESASSVGNVFGRDDKKKEIITLLLNDDHSGENYVVIPFVGKGGIGKTTLAQYVYEDEQKYVYKDEQLYAHNEQKCNFDLKAWVCVSDVFDVKRVTKDIINTATQCNFDYSSLEQATVKLQELLKGKKFLIVLDDVWSEKYDDWYKLQIPFQRGAKGSRVIITTRSESIAKKTTKNHNNIIHLQGLSNDDCWCLFQHHANEITDNPKMKNDIVRKCKGLPLAARALGGLLKSTTEESQRRKILESNVWAEEYDEECSVLPVLRLSYHHLPSHLKRVFAYCSVLPKDYKFEEMEIIQLWMAQGFLPDNKDRRMEDIGHDYFNNLVSRSLFEKCTFPYGRRFTMHDLIHDVANIAAGSICSVMDGTDTRTELRRTRHLFITEHVQTLGNQIMASQLRTFLSGYGLKIDYSDFFEKIRHIRTLSLHSNEIETLPECIGDLKHLRNLSFKFLRIKELPPSIGNLWNLQTLCLERCLKLEKVPCVESLGKLRHLYIRDTSLKEMPRGIEKLTNLQTLDTFVLAIGGGSRVRELGKLTQLRGRLLTVSGLQNVTKVKDAEEAQLSKKENLEWLNLGWGWGTCIDHDEVDDKTRRDVVEELRPHISIKYCVLDRYMGSKFPWWLGDPAFINLVDIKLKHCQNCVCFPPLEKLSSLKRLLVEDMDGIKEVGREFYENCSTPFPSLKTLRFLTMKSWEKWVHPPVVVDNINKAFPILEELSIDDCPLLQGDIPSHLPSLRMLKINGVEQLQSLELKNSWSATSHLEEVIVSKCKSMASIGQIPLTLKFLEIDDCEKLEYVEFDEHRTNLSCESDNEKGLKSEESIGVSSKDALELPLLTILKIERCPSLISLQQSLLLPALRLLQLQNCENMEWLPVEWHKFTSLKELLIEECPKIHSLAECIPCSHLSLPSSLSTLKIQGFQNLKTISFNGSTLPNLTHLSIKGTKIDKPIKEWGLHLLTSLDDLRLTNVGSCADTVECISYPDFPSSLGIIWIEGFQNLKTICCSTLPALCMMGIKNCPKLESFGDNGLPPHIQWVHIEECDMIEQQLTSDPYGCIETENGIFSLPLSGSQPSSANSTC